ncbi:hypothetical protein FB446DRAFT_470405 [Lentinula raphanica]|nr:hypothetical protein FB446DRAFT_470405 [Lentinula raphanica]
MWILAFLCSLYDPALFTLSCRYFCSSSLRVHLASPPTYQAIHPTPAIRIRFVLNEPVFPTSRLKCCSARPPILNLSILLYIISEHLSCFSCLKL